ncbi:radical SAM protein [Limnochorda pilosa]|uniref:Fe-S oxidoreductase n=1 Tax=Limnochorda pilosa TaxID=1555112 RepID=A0A0K2SFW8_LIMPI|nr:radical SAM protein [Limnochorda pilosa]BAS25985.1 Fe-S oxidoreductase [Limnochorda pilosa]
MPQAEATGGHPGRPAWDLGTRPVIVIWEVTHACALACVHCRAAADPHRHPEELTTQEGYALIDSVARLNPAIFVLSGGDPLMREDLFDLIAYARTRGLRVAAAPTGSARATPEAMQRFREAGVNTLSFSLDGPDAVIHDSFRRVRGTFDRTVKAIEAARELGIPFQINTTVTRATRPHLDRLREQVQILGAVQWDLFILVPTGRGESLEPLSPPEYEAFLGWLAGVAEGAPFRVKTTEGPQFRRMQAVLRGEPPERLRPGVNAGKGYVFVSNRGKVFPSGFLPLEVGDVRATPLDRIYRENPVLHQLRDASLLKGRCGQCPFDQVCGGSRSRAYAATGDYLAEDPLCGFDPAQVRTA